MLNKAHCWEDGGVGSTRNLTPHLYYNCTSRICMKYFGIVKSVKACNFQGEARMVNYG